MDLSGWNAQVAGALRTLEADSPRQAEDAAAALSWLIGEAGPEALTQARVQEFLWFVLPRKFLSPLEGHLAVADGLAAAMDLLDLHRYAELCRSERTRAILHAWESSREAGFAAARKAMTDSRVEPPDFDGFRWGSTFGPEELAALEGVEAALELAIEGGILPKAGRGANEARERFVSEWMRRPRPAFDGGSALRAVERERIDDWLGRRPARRALIEPVARSLQDEVGTPYGLEGALAPLQWMLTKIGAGMRVTERGYLDPSFVREAADAFGWHEWGGSPKSEADVPAVMTLHEMAKDLRAIRRTGKEVALTRKGAEWAVRADALWRAVAGWIGEGGNFRHAVTEPALALLLSGGRMSRKELLSMILAVILEAGWHVRGAGQPAVTEVNVEAGLWQFLRPAFLLGMMDRAVYPEDWLELTDVGRATALLALRLRATGPRTTP